MKCIRCGRDSKRKERAGRQCPGCGGQFAFEPGEGDLITDLAFKNAIDAVSADGEIRFGVEHLYYEVCRRRRRYVPKPGHLAAMSLAFIVFLLLFFTFQHPLLAACGLGLGAVLAWALWRRSRARRSLSVSETEFNHMWARWRGVHGTPASVIVRRSTPALASLREPDVADYSFDRAVICDRARTVDLLLANNFHFEHNCAVLSTKGYPPAAFDMVRNMLRRNPRLEVYALHDATEEGCRIARRVEHEPEWFKGGPATDVGIRPTRAMHFPELLIRSQTPQVAPGGGISGAEAKWLSQYSLELAALRPEQILRAVFRAMHPVAETAGSSSSDDSSSDSFG